jgi:hypothetical protein
MESIMTKHTYTYLQFVSNLPGYRTKGGGYYKLRRDDGKLVRGVSRKRFNQLVDENRVVLEKDGVKNEN